MDRRILDANHEVEAFADILDNLTNITQAPAYKRVSNTARELVENIIDKCMNICRSIRIMIKNLETALKQKREATVILESLAPFVCAIDGKPRLNKLSDKLERLHEFLHFSLCEDHGSDSEYAREQPEDEEEIVFGRNEHQKIVILKKIGEAFENKGKL